MNSGADLGLEETRPGRRKQTHAAVKTFAPSLLKGRLGMGSAAGLAQHPIPVTLLVSRCVSVPILLDS